MVKPDLVSPWIPMTNPQDLKAIGKLGEETCELGAAIFRCVIQQIDEAEPVTGKVNRQWLQEEIADVKANIDLVIEYFNLDARAIDVRANRKRELLDRWHEMIPEAQS